MLSWRIPPALRTPSAWVTLASLVWLSQIQTVTSIELQAAQPYVYTGEMIEVAWLGDGPYNLTKSIITKDEDQTIPIPASSLWYTTQQFLIYKNSNQTSYNWLVNGSYGIEPIGANVTFVVLDIPTGSTGTYFFQVVDPSLVDDGSGSSSGDTAGNTTGSTSTGAANSDAVPARTRKSLVSLMAVLWIGGMAIILV